MADVPFYEAYIVVYDSAQKAGRVGLRVDATDGKAYVAAADDAARAATKVGLLLASVGALMLDHPAVMYKSGVDSGFLNDEFVQPPASDQNYRSNKLKVDYATTNNGAPATGSFSIPMRDPAEYGVESNGINVTIGAGATAEITDLLTQVVDTLQSKYGTAVSAVAEITVNDS